MDKMKRRIGLRIKLATRRLDAGRRKLPDFLIIGAQKSGTTYLHRLLQQHPSIRAGLKKEIHYFDRHYAKSEQWYRAHFHVINSRRNQLCFEATPDYLYHNQVPGRVSEMMQDILGILILRNPVERAYSHYQMMRRRSGNSGDEFEFAVRKEKHALEKGNFNFKNDGKHAYLARSLYHIQVKNWLQHFPLRQIHAIQSEDMFRDPEKEVNKIFQFLGIGSHNVEPFNARINKGDYHRMDHELYEELCHFFRPMRSELEDLLKKDFPWKL